MLGTVEQFAKNLNSLIECEKSQAKEIDDLRHRLKHAEETILRRDMESSGLMAQVKKLSEELVKAASYAINPPIMVKLDPGAITNVATPEPEWRAPKGEAMLRDNNGCITTVPIEWKHGFFHDNVAPVSKLTRGGKTYYLQFHQRRYEYVNSHIALYTEDGPR